MHNAVVTLKWKRAYFSWAAATKLQNKHFRFMQIIIFVHSSEAKLFLQACSTKGEIVHEKSIN